MENEILEGIVEEDFENVNEETDNSGGQVLAILGIGALAIGAGVAAFIYTQRDKIEQKRIEKLRKKGYVIFKQEDPDSEDDLVEDFEGEIEED